MIVPSEYVEGYHRACQIDAVLAEKYVRHTTLGDPEADAVTELLETQFPERRHEWLGRGIEGGPDAIPDAPILLRDFFAAMEATPDWFSSHLALPGCRAFHRNSQMFLGAFVGAVLIEGFSTLISKSFSITGRLVDQGVRRLKQNNRHLLEIFMPGGQEPHADGWQLSVRIRLVHAHVRRLLSFSEDWDSVAWGTPLSSAHIGYAAASFSALLLKRSAMLGVRLSEEEKVSFMNVWRNSARLMGVSPELLFENEKTALRLQEIGAICEPPPDLESCMLANGLVNAAPVVAGITEPKARRKLVRKIYQVSRALIGNEKADLLSYPPARTFGVLTTLRLTNRLDHFLQKRIPALASRRVSSQFLQMIDLSHYEESGIAVRMPSHVHAEKDKPL